MASESSVGPTMAFWEPGMPAKAFNIDRVKADLADGSCTVFPVEDYKQYLIERVREMFISQEKFKISYNPNFNFTVEPYELWYSTKAYYYHITENHEFSNECGSYDDDREKYVSGVAYICYGTYNDKYELLQITIWIGNETGFDNHSPNFIRAAYKVTWIDDSDFNGNENCDLNCYSDLDSDQESQSN